MRVFLAAPFGSKFDPHGRVFDETFKLRLTRIMDEIRAAGYSLRSCFEREDWGKTLQSPNVCAPLDLEWITESDLIVAYIDEGDPLRGVNVEIGWAAAKRKRIILLIPRRTKLSSMLIGISKVTPTYFIHFEEEKEMLMALASHLKQLPKESLDKTRPVTEPLSIVEPAF